VIGTGMPTLRDVGCLCGAAQHVMPQWLRGAALKIIGIAIS
jgi:hypothetical protein